MKITLCWKVKRAILCVGWIFEGYRNLNTSHFPQTISTFSLISAMFACLFLRNVFFFKTHTLTHTYTHKFNWWILDFLRKPVKFVCGCKVVVLDMITLEKSMNTWSFFFIRNSIYRVTLGWKCVNVDNKVIRKTPLKPLSSPSHCRQHLCTEQIISSPAVAMQPTICVCVKFSILIWMSMPFFEHLKE